MRLVHAPDPRLPVERHGETNPLRRPAAPATMPRVAVVGGGAAGVFAALAAARLGADATLFESSQRVGVSRALMPLMLSDGRGEDGLVLPEARELSGAGVEVRKGFEVAAVARREGLLEVVRRSNGGERARFDSVVVSTGTAPSVPQVRGASKPGVFVLRGPSDYLALSEGLGSIERVAVSGPVLLGLKVGEALARRGRSVSVYCGASGLGGQLSAPVAAMLRRSAIEGGVGAPALVDGSIDSILGVGRVEAVASGGRVSACDAVVLVPKGAPSYPDVGCARGPNGGLLVDSSMETSVPGVFAAGDSAEVRFKAGSVPARLFSTARVGGEVAGANASGGMRTASFSWAMEQTVLGVELCTAGLSEAEARSVGLDPATVECAFPGEGSPGQTLVSMVYDRPTRLVCGLELAGWRASSLAAAASMVVGLGLTADRLVHLESPYAPGLAHERSPISLTARQIPELQGA